VNVQRWKIKHKNCGSGEVKNMVRQFVHCAKFPTSTLAAHTFASRLHPGSHVDCVSKEAVSRHGHAHHARRAGTRM
jgi:hypothetical protein